MAKFIKFNIVDSSTPANQKVHLLDIDNIDEKRAAELIMTARAPWFVDQK